MRILFIADTYRPARTACANRTFVLAEALQEAGHDVQVLASTDSFIDAPALSAPLANATYFSTFPLANKKTLATRLRNNVDGLMKSQKAAKALGEFDVIVCATPPLLLTSAAVSIAKSKKAKLVLDIRDIWPDVAYEMESFVPNSLYGKVFTFFAKRAYRAADLVSTVSPGKVIKLSARLNATPIELVPNGVDETFVCSGDNISIINRFDLSTRATCVYTGNIGLAQGLGTMLDIAKQRPQVQFLLFGKGGAKESLQRRVDAERLSNVEFPGTLDEQGVRTVLRHASLAYVPLINSNLRDSIPTKMFEALACGCPVLLAAEGDAADVIDQCGFGAHVAPEDSTALLAKFDELMAKQYSQEEREAASRWVLENYSRQKFAKDFVRAISELSKER